MFKTSLIALKILAGIMQHLAMVQGIIVERNLHSYYRLPVAAVRRSNASDDYFVLQCPFKSSLDIPKPKDMGVCTIVDRYSHNQRDDEIKPVTEHTIKPKHFQNSKAEHRNLKPPPKQVKWIKIKKRKPPPKKMMMKKGKPFKMKEYYKRPKTEIKEKYTATNVRLYLDHPKAASETKIVVNGKPVQVHDTLASSSSVKPKIVKNPRDKQKLADSDDFIDEDFSDSGEIEKQHSSHNSPLKYLGTKDVLNKLQLQKKPSPESRGSADKTEKFFAQSNKYKKGFKTKGYQNMYHRDEIYQDHIFYDDLQQRGNYDVHKKSKQKI